MMKNSGIYSILNKKNGKIYVGLTNSLPTRQSKHFSLLRNNKHPNTHLQSSFNKYGESSFEFNVLEYCDINELDKNEDWWINYFNSTDSNYGYNKRGGGHSNYSLSDETKAKLREHNSHMKKQNHNCWGTSVIEQYDGLEYLKKMASTGITRSELAKKLKLSSGSIQSYLDLRGTSWSELSSNDFVPQNSRRQILIELGGLDFLIWCKSEGMRLVDVVERYELGSRSVIHKYLKTFGLKWSELG